jgi:hypothetical protein
MTPKEKALELVSKMCLLDCRDENITIAKQCALICVDEVLESNEKISLKDLRETMETNDILCQLTDNAMYWQEVKEEINKL